MIALIIFPIIWAAVACGSQVNIWAKAEPANSLPLERRLFGLAVGLVLLAYCILILGLIGLLSAVPIFSCCVIQGAVGWKEHARILRELADFSKQLRFDRLSIFAAVFFIIFAASALVGCFTPPTSIEYDALVYHLGDPKIYLANHRIIYLPWESHSNFAFTMEMLYTLGLSVHSVPLAKLFHWFLGLAAVAATLLIGRRIHSSTVGIISALIFSSMPIVFWEAGTAYVDLAATSFGALGLLGLVAALDVDNADPAWLRVSALMMACMVSVKATSLIPTGLMGIGVALVFYHRSKNLVKSVVPALTYTLSAVLLGSAWYIKSWIVTGNPFFPFAYSIFGGRHWSTANANVYSQSQSAFGMGHTVQNLLLAPWNLTLFILPWNLQANVHYFNDFNAVFITLTPILLAALFVPAFWYQKTSPGVRLVALFGIVSLVIWFVLTQQVRYILPTMPVYSVLAGVVVVEIWKVRSISRYALAALLVVSLGFSAFVSSLLIQQEAPVAVGAVSSDAFISAGFPPYASMQWLNRSTTQDSGVVIYGEPEDFYLDRRHMWGEPGHGIVIPYDTMQSSDDLKNWFLIHHYQYILINAVNAQIGSGSGMNGLIYGLTYGSGNQPVFQDRAITVWFIR